MNQSTGLNGRTCLVTGANSGIGFVIAKEFAGMGGNVIMVCRDNSKGQVALEQIKEATRSQLVELMIADLASLSAVRKLADDFKRSHEKLHILVNNAGLILGKRTVTEDGLEATFQINYLSHFLLTNLLLDLLKASAPSRIVNVASTAHFAGKMNFDDLQEEHGYGAMKSYSQSKLAQVLFTHKLSEQLNGTNVSVNCVHPGAVRTHWGDEAGALGIGIRLARPLMINPDKGAETPIFVATSQEIEGVSGRYFARKRVKDSSKESNNEEEARKLWDVSLKLSGLQ